MIIRASSLPRIMSCSASRIAPELRIESDGDPAKMGRIVHEMIAQYVGDGNEPTDESTLVLMAKEGLGRKVKNWKCENLEECKILYYSARKIWAREFEGAVDLVSVEKQLSIELPGGFTLRGTSDIICKAETGGLLIAVDWKSGWLTEKDFDDQLKAYLLLASTVHPEILENGGIIITCFIRDMRTDTLVMSGDELKAWVDRLGRALTGKIFYNPNFENCRYCKRFLECEARNAYESNAVEAFSGDDFPQAIPTYYDKYKTAEAACKKFKDALKVHVAEFGAQDLPDGRELAIRETTYKTIMPDVVAIARALDMPVEAIQDKIFKPRVIDKAAVEQLAIDSAPRGGIGKAKKEIMYRLEAEGAVSRTVRQSARPKKKR